MSAGFKAYVDPVTGGPVPGGPITGEGSARPDDAMPPLELDATHTTSSRGLREIASPEPGGGVSVDLQGRFRAPLEATLAPERRPSIPAPRRAGNPSNRALNPGSGPRRQASRFMGRAARLLWLLTLFSAAIGPAQAADLKVINRDGRREGFRDRSAPDVDSAIGLNPGTTLGQQRLIAFRAAAAIWAERIQSPVRIRIDARFDPLDCDASSAVLGAAGPNSVHRDFRGARAGKTWYVQALANALAKRDLKPGMSDIDAEFNSTLGMTCAFPDVWYYGLDGLPPGTKIDFVTVVLHELGHGLGFLSLVDLETGEKFMGLNDIYMRRLKNTRTGRRYPQMTDRERVRASRSGKALSVDRPASGHREHAPRRRGGSEKAGPDVRAEAPGARVLGVALQHLALPEPVARAGLYRPGPHPGPRAAAPARSRLEAGGRRSVDRGRRFPGSGAAG